MAPKIEVKHLSCKMGNRYLLHDINWRVQDGEHWLIFGENGSGKTTLLSSLLGYRQCQAEMIHLFGTRYDPQQVLQMRRRIGWVSTSFFNKVLRNESVLSIVLSGKSGTLGINDFISRQDLLSAKKLLEAFHLKNRKDMPYCTLSKGEQQSVLLARAFMADPEILFLDEPDSGLDYLARDYLADVLNGLAEEKTVTMLYVTHYPEEIPGFLTHCMLLQNGKVFKQGAMDDVFCSAVLSDFFVQPLKIEKQARGYHFALQKGERQNVCKS